MVNHGVSKPLGSVSGTFHAQACEVVLSDGIKITLHRVLSHRKHPIVAGNHACIRLCDEMGDSWSLVLPRTSS